MNPGIISSLSKFTHYEAVNQSERDSYKNKVELDIQYHLRTLKKRQSHFLFLSYLAEARGNWKAVPLKPKSTAETKLWKSLPVLLKCPA